MFSIEKTKRLAELSKLNLTDAEISKMSSELDKILGMISEVTSINLDVSELNYGREVGLEDLRDDVACVSMANEKLLSNAPKKYRGAFVVPLMIEE